MKQLIGLKTFLVTMAMIGAAYAAHTAHPDRMLVDELPPLELAREIPEVIGDWRMLPDAGNRVVNPQAKALIDSLYSETLTRTYVNSIGNVMMLSIAYGKNQSDDKAVHYPEVCYPAQGLAIQSSVKDQLKINDAHTIPVKRLVAKRDTTLEPITYWVTVGEQITLTSLQHKRAQLEYGFKGLIPDGMIFRVSSLGEATKDDYKTQDEFIRSLSKQLQTDVSSRIFGRPPRE